MKKFIGFLVAVGLVLYGASPLFAGGLINKNNLSAEYIRTMNRAAATDSADIVAYNPAGVTALQDGMYANLSVQYIAKDYENTFGGTNYDQDEPSTVPSFYSVWKKGQWAAFFGFNVPVGGGKVDYGQGNALTAKFGGAMIGLTPGFANYSIQSMKMEGESYGLGYTFGGAYRINKMFSVSVGARFIDARKELQGDVTITSPLGPGAPFVPSTATADLEYTADGWGYIFGLDIFVSEKATIGIKYETKTSLNYTYDVKPGTNATGQLLLAGFGVTTGTEAHEDLPASFSLGASYNITPAFRVEPTFTYYMNAVDADIGGAFAASKTLENRISNGYDLGIAFEYAFSETFKTSLGFLWTDTGIKANDMTPWLPELDARSICTGIAWTVMPNLDLNFGVGMVDYLSDTTSAAAFYPNTEYNKSVIYGGFGIQYKFF